jgi:WD40 repeat protein
MLWNPAASHPFSQTATKTAPAGSVGYSDQLDDFVWLAEHGEALGTVEGGAILNDAFDIAATAFAPSPATATLAVGYLDGSLTMFAAGSQIGASAPLLGHTAPIGALAFSADGEVLGVGDASGKLSVWDVEEQLMLHESELPEFGVVDVALDGHGGCLLVTDTSGALWQWCYGAEAAPELIGDTVMRAGPLAFDYSDRLLAVGTDADQIQVWDLGHEPATVSHVIDADGSIAALSTAAGRVAAKSDADTVGVWDIGSGRSLGTIPAPDSSDVALGAGGEVLAVAGPTGLVLWDLRVQALTELACRVSNRNLTQSEWDFYVGGDYEQTCPGLAMSDE